MASGASGIDSGLGAPVVHEPDLAAVAPMFDVTVGQDEPGRGRGRREEYEVGVVDTICGGGTDGLRMARSEARRVCIGPLTPGHEYLLRWRVVSEDEYGPMSGGDDVASRGPWGRAVRVRCGAARPVEP